MGCGPVWCGNGEQVGDLGCEVGVVLSERVGSFGGIETQAGLSVWVNIVEDGELGCYGSVVAVGVVAGGYSGSMSGSMYLATSSFMKS